MTDPAHAVVAHDPVLGLPIAIIERLPLSPPVPLVDDVDGDRIPFAVGAPPLTEVGGTGGGLVAEVTDLRSSLIFTEHS